MAIQLKANGGNIRLSQQNISIDLQAPVQQIGSAVDSVNGMTGDVIIDIPSKTSELENDSGFITQHQSLADYANKNDLAAKQDKLTAGDNITIANGVISAAGGGGIKSFDFDTNPTGGSTDFQKEAANQYKEQLTYLWSKSTHNGKTSGSIDLSANIITINGELINEAYCEINAQYIYFYPAVSTNLNRITRYFYSCNYSNAIQQSSASEHRYITKAEYSDAILTSNNYTQYISTSGNYTQDTSDSSLSNATELYIGINTNDGRKTSVNIQLPQNYYLYEKTNEYFYFPESEASNGYVYYDGTNLNVSGANSIEYIWYK